MEARDRLIVALDVPSLDEAELLAERLRGLVRWFKVGIQLFSAAGPAAVASLARRGRVFLDLKFHDIPSVVAGAVEAAARAGAELCTVHILGGSAMLRAAQEAADRSETRPRLVGVTLLTSADEAALREIGLPGTSTELVLRLARLAQASGLAGVVASPLEATLVRETCGPGFLIVCPGIRPERSTAEDQRRTHTPREALKAGADMVIVGRPITRAPDPRAAVEAVLREISDR